MQQFLKKPTNSIISLGWGVAPREVVDALGTKADGVIGEMPSNIPGPKAPNPKAQAWLDKFNKLYKHQVPAGSWIMYSCGQGCGPTPSRPVTGDPGRLQGGKQVPQGERLRGRVGQNQVRQGQRAPGPGLRCPICHYQVQGGELQAIFADPPMTPYPGSKFMVPSWIKQ